MYLADDALVTSALLANVPENINYVLPFERQNLEQAN
jgi:hypothetical protein